MSTDEKNFEIGSSIFETKTNMRIRNIILIALAFSYTLNIKTQDMRENRILNKNWIFFKGDYPYAQTKEFDDSKWGKATVPHDWAIYGPFDRE